jgi:hypothetical protein
MAFYKYRILPSTVFNNSEFNAGLVWISYKVVNTLNSQAQEKEKVFDGMCHFAACPNA